MHKNITTLRMAVLTAAMLYALAPWSTMFPATPVHGAAIDSPALPRAGDAFPDQTFTAPAQKNRAEYLGVAANATFALSDLKRKYILLQLFNVYCPHCQAEAREFNHAWNLLSRPALAKDLSFMAVAVGNSLFEVKLFRDKYNVAHPVVLDPDYAFHENVGSPGTPTYFLLKNDGAKGLKVVWVLEGRYKSPDQFVADVRKHMGE